MIQGAGNQNLESNISYTNLCGLKCNLYQIICFAGVFLNGCAIPGTFITFHPGLVVGNLFPLPFLAQVFGFVQYEDILNHTVYAVLFLCLFVWGS